MNRNETKTVGVRIGSQGSNGVDCLVSPSSSASRMSGESNLAAERDFLDGLSRFADVFSKWDKSVSLECLAVLSKIVDHHYGVGEVVGSSAGNVVSESASGMSRSSIRRRKRKAAAVQKCVDIEDGSLVSGCDRIAAVATSTHVNYFSTDQSGFCYLAAVLPEYREGLSLSVGPVITFRGILALANQKKLLEDGSLKAIFIEKRATGGYHVTEDKRTLSLFQALAGICARAPLAPSVIALCGRFGGATEELAKRAPDLDATLAGDNVALEPVPRLCTHWLHHGTCEYTVVGCKFRHVMPASKLELKAYGLSDYPSWWKGNRAEKWRRSSSASSKASATSSSRSNVVSSEDRLLAIETSVQALSAKHDDILAAVTAINVNTSRFATDDGETLVATKFVRGSHGFLSGWRSSVRSSDVSVTSRQLAVRAWLSVMLSVSEDDIPLDLCGLLMEPAFRSKSSGARVIEMLQMVGVAALTLATIAECNEVEHTVQATEIALATMLSDSMLAQTCVGSMPDELATGFMIQLEFGAVESCASFMEVILGAAYQLFGPYGVDKVRSYFHLTT